MPIFMIGTRRSGSNLLRLMLNQLPDIAAPHPPHVMLRIMPLLPRYGDLNHDRNFALLVNDVCRLVELNPVPWEGVTLDRSDIITRCRTRTVVAIFGAVYDVYAQTRGARTWVCKSLENVHFLPEIDAYFPNARYIYLYRDGRDVAVSFRKVIVGQKHFYHIAKEWTNTQRLALSQRAVTPPERFIEISYEELTENPERTTRRLCAWLGVPYLESMLEFYKSEDAKRTAESSAVWANVTRPIMNHNSRKFLREASEEDIRIFETVAGNVLDTLGYERVHVQRGQERKFTQRELLAFDEENKRLQQEITRRADAEDLKRRDRQDALLAEIVRREASAASSGAAEALLGPRAGGIGIMTSIKK